MNNNDKNKSKAILLLIVFTLLYLLVIQPIILTHWENTDLHRHLIKAQGDCENAEQANWSKEACEIYKPLLGLLGNVFSGSVELFSTYGFIIIGILIPITLFWITKNWISILFYFTTTSFFYYHIDGIYAQALATLFAIMLLGTKDWRLELLLVILATLAHGHGLPLAILILIGKYIPKGILACTGTFGNATPEIFNQKIGQSIGGINTTVASLIHPFTRIIPIPFLALSFYQNMKDKKTELLFLTIVGLIGGFVVSTRVFYIVSIPMIIGLTSFYLQNQKKWGKYLIIGALLMGIYQLYAYLNLKACIGYF
ncbi:hypothetical protein LCGC14_1066090 [marine sediment metagenome]|uniref:Glycosyltransferase RgtA/B/C/D-like domain-containing protein n=1 Tax=marine sediment metagenome TaxID=412755 RepID=A0A0F9N6N9_9ZZZZ